MIPALENPAKKASWLALGGGSSHAAALFNRCASQPLS
jgi:hypothetical protein